MDTTDYLYRVLVPAAESFRILIQGTKRQFMAIKNSKSCRVKFVNKSIEKEWLEFCKKNNLQNDADLEY
ncbi:hypothetical protein [Serratia proteamaculans]|uniref:hypothetical protein n=1 Tax=Serratia proteamaculans TaxID=28151 RepID=UPI001F5DBF54|nr:hypothetical protein [Serratia proteamaculans]